MSKVKLGDVAEEVKETYDGNGYPAIVGLEHLVPGDIRLKSWSTDIDNTFTKAFHKGQVLFGRRRAYLKKAAVAPVDGICSGDITVISAKQDKILPELLPFVIQNDDFFDYAVGKSAGSLSPRVKWSHLKEYEFNLPGMDQQRQLANLLWHFVDAKEAYEDLIHQTDELVKSQFIEMFGYPGRVDKGYPVRRLGDVCTVERGGSPRPIANYTTNDPHGLNWIKIGDADTDRYITHTAEKIKPEGLSKTRQVYAGDLLLSNSMSFGRPYILKIDGCIHDGWLVLHFDKSEMDAIYLQTFLSLPDTFSAFSKMAEGAVVNNLNSAVVKELPVLVPSINEQKQYREIAEQSDKSKFELNEAIKDLDAMYKRIIKDNLG
jgi:type I restriction enzyme S subunit